MRARAALVALVAALVAVSCSAEPLPSESLATSPPSESPATSPPSESPATSPPAEFPATDGQRVGAICADGWRSEATGSGACSWHGGVARWLYAEDEPSGEPRLIYLNGKLLGTPERVAELAGRVIKHKHPGLDYLDAWQRCEKAFDTLLLHTNLAEQDREGFRAACAGAAFGAAG